MRAPTTEFAHLKRKIEKRTVELTELGSFSFWAIKRENVAYHRREG